VNSKHANVGKQKKALEYGMGGGTFDYQKPNWMKQLKRTNNIQMCARKLIKIWVLVAKFY
jgi:hypothetical protein